MREMRAIAFVTRLIDSQHLDPHLYARMLIHAVRDDAVFAELGVASKLDPDWAFLCRLRDAGRRSAAHWLETTYERIGQDFDRRSGNDVSLAIGRSGHANRDGGDIVQQRYALGIDIGGTFTDIVVYDTASGRQASHKELTTHDDPSRGVMAAIDRVIREHNIPPASIARVVHATTLFTNALIERKGAVTGLITTRGFRDTLEIGRERKYELYDIAIQQARAAGAARPSRLEVAERMLVDGRVLTPTRRGRAASPLPSVSVALGATSLAVVFLHSYANPAHEQRAVELIAKRFPELALSPPRSTWRPRSASTSAPRRPSPTPTSSRWPSAISDACRRDRRSAASRRRCC